MSERANAMMDAAAALAGQQAELAAILAGLDASGWATESRCPGWTVADVVLHLAQTDELAVASFEGRFVEDVALLSDGVDGAGVTNADDWAAFAVARERGPSGPAVADRYLTAAAALRDAVATADPAGRFPWVAGDLSGPTLTTTRLSEAWIHTGDIAEPLGVDLPATARLRLVARLAWRTLPYAFARAGVALGGPVAFELTGPDGAAWSFRPDGDPSVSTIATTIRGPAEELCLVAARRLAPAATSLTGDGPDSAAVLRLVRTFA